MTTPSAPTTSDAERRVAPRMRTLRRATVLFNNRFSTIDCIVRNISTTGALLTLDSAVQLPKTFEIGIGDESYRPARLVYRREMFAGIHFLDAPEEEATALSQIQAPGLQAVDTTQAGSGIDRIVPPPLPRVLRARFPWFTARG